MSEGGAAGGGGDDLGRGRGPERPHPEGGYFRGVILPASITVLVVMLIAWAARTRADGDHGSDGGHAPGQTGAPAPGFSLPAVDLEDEAVSLGSFRGDVVVLNFWASWCGPCRQEAPGLRTLSDEYRDRGVSFIGIDERDNREDALSFLSEFSITYPNAFDPSGALADRYGLLGLPATVVIDPSGIISNRFIGFLEDEVLREALDAELGRSGPVATAG